MRPRGYVEAVRYLRTNWKPLHSRDVASLTRADIAERLDALARESGPVAADRARTALSSFYSWLVQRRSDVSNPVIGTAKIADETPRERALTDAELVAVWNAANPSDDFGRIVRLLILTGCRRNEISALTWSEVHLSEAAGESEIRLPGARTKNGRSHVVPLSGVAVSTLRAIVRTERDYVFGRARKGFSGHSRCKAALDAKSGVTGWVLHDLRRTVRTGLGRLGIAPHVAEAAVNHLPPKLIRTYDVNAYETEKRVALDTWAAHVATILARAEGANVTCLRRKEATG